MDENIFANLLTIAREKFFKFMPLNTENNWIVNVKKNNFISHYKFDE